MPEKFHLRTVCYKLGAIPTTLACPVVVLSCFACLVFRTIPRPFEATKTGSGLKVIRLSAFVD